MDLKELFTWHRDFPSMPKELTSIQKKDWISENEDKINKSFIEQKLITCKAKISDITSTEILCYSDYFQDEPSGAWYAQINYWISYDQQKDLLALKELHKTDTIEFDGVIKKIGWWNYRVFSKTGDNNAKFQIEFFEKKNTNPIYNYQTLDVPVAYRDEPNYCLNIALDIVSIRKINPTKLSSSLLGYNPPKIKSKDNCFIATAAYGSRDKSEVISLRLYRDEVLGKNLIGRYFIALYYFLSPPIAFVISRNIFLRRLTRIIIRLLFKSKIT